MSQPEDLMDADPSPEQEVVQDVVGDVEVEPSCEESSETVLAGQTEPVDVETTLSPEEERELDELMEAGDGVAEEEDETAERRGAPGLGPPGAGWGGAQAPVQRPMGVGSRSGLTITSKQAQLG